MILWWEPKNVNQDLLVKLVVCAGTSIHWWHKHWHTWEIWIINWFIFFLQRGHSDKQWQELQQQQYWDLKSPLCTREWALVNTSLWGTNCTRGTLKRRGGLQKNNTDAGPERLQTQHGGGSTKTPKRNAKWGQVRERRSNYTVTSSSCTAETPSSATGSQRLLHWQNCTVMATATETLTFYSSATKICSSSGILNM